MNDTPAIRRRAARSFAVFPKRLWALAALLVAGALSLGSSVAFCESPDIYTSAQDLSNDFSHRWHKGRGWASAEWTPDGSRIVLGHAGGIYVVAADGTEMTSLSGSYEPLMLYSKTAEIDFSPTLSPDGSRVAYATLRYAQGELREHTYEIAVQPLDGSDRVRLTENGRDDIAPSWSPDGSRIAFASPQRGDDIRIFTIAPDGSGERELVPSSLAAQCCALAWSPDGGRLAFMAERRETASVEWAKTLGRPESEVEVIRDYAVRRQSLYTVKADGSGLVELAWSETPNSAPKTRFGSFGLYEPEEYVSSLQWSPDGERLAFAARRYGEKTAIYVADADGASVRRILDLSAIADCGSDLEYSIFEIRWLSDGSRIEFAAGRDYYYDPADCPPIADVYSVSPDGSDLRVLPPTIDIYDYLRWRGNVAGGSGPKRTVIYTDNDNPNLSPEVRERILSTAPWGKSQETVLVKIVDNRLTAAEPDQTNQPVDAGAECDKAIPSGRGYSGLAEDCRTLLEIKDVIAGDGFLNWTGDRPISEWDGIAVEDERVRALEIMGMSRRGSVPPRIGELTELRTLHVTYSELVGEIPAELGNLSKLEILYIGEFLGRNPIPRRIPPELGSLSNLRELGLSGNRLVGEIPAELGGLSNLAWLHLDGNELEGEIPPELGSLSNLEELNLYGNELEGEIPAELGNLSNLAWLRLYGNELEGEIPAELGNLSNLTGLHLDGNELEGEIPAELGSLSNLIDLNLSGNELEGEIPAELGSLSNLFDLNLSDNELEGEIPPELRDIPNLNHVDLTENHRLVGCVPPKRMLGASWKFYCE